MIDIGAFGLSITVVAIQSFPMGFPLSQFADDVDPLTVEATEPFGYEMLYDGNMFSFDKANVVKVSVSVIPGSDDDINLKLLLQSKKGAVSILPLPDMTSMVISYPSGTVLLTNGTMVSVHWPIALTRPPARRAILIHSSSRRLPEPRALWKSSEPLRRMSERALMTQSLLSALFSSPSLQITNEQTGATVLLSIRTLRVALLFPSKAARHMMEAGNTVVDQRVLLPIGIVIDLISPDANTLAQVNNITADRASTYMVSTRGIVVESLRVNAEALDQTPDNISSTPTRLNFTQMLYQGQTSIVYVQSSDASLIDRGMTVLTTATQTVSDTFTKVQGLISGAL